MPTNVSYLTYADTENPNDYPETWVAQSICDASPTPSAPWITVPIAEFATIMAAQQAEFAEIRDEENMAALRAVRIKEAWSLAWEHIFKWYDTGGLIRFVSWLIDEKANPTGKAMIDGIRQWVDGVMAVYLFVYKPTIQAGGSVIVDYAADVGDAPFTFTQVIVTCNTPWFTTQPSNESVADNETAEFTAVTDGYPTRTYQWQRSNDGGTTWNDVSGATTQTLSFTAVTADNGAKFRLKTVNNTVSVGYSDIVTLTVS